MGRYWPLKEMPMESGRRRLCTLPIAATTAALVTLAAAPTAALGQVDTYPALATHIEPAVDELFAEDDGRIEDAVARLAEQDVESLAVDLCVEPERFRLSAVATLVVASTDPLVELELNDDLSVLSVSCDGRPLAFMRDGRSLTVRPGALTGDVVEIEVAYEGVLTPGPGIRLHKGLVVLGGKSAWYPSPRYGDMCSFRTVVRYPEGYTSVCTGSLAGMTPSVTDSENGCVLGDVWDTGVPVPSAAVAVGTFASSYSVWGDVFLGYHMLVDPDDETPDEVDLFSSELKELVRYAESCYGPYPFDWLSVVYIPGFPAGLPAIDTAPGVVILAGVDVPRGMRSPRPERVLAGLSKSWWPCSIDAGAIVSDGLAGQMEIDFLREMGDEGAAVARREYLRSMYITALADSGGRASLRDCMKGRRSPDRRVCGTRSQALMGILEEVVGRDVFCAALTGLGGRFKGGMLPLREFVAAFEEEDGRDLDWLVYEWVYRGDLPTYILTYDVSREGGGYLIEGVIAQRGEPFRTPVPLTIDLGVWSYDEWISIGSPEQPFTLAAELEPQSISLDAGNIVPRIEADELAAVHFAKGTRAADANEWGTAVDEFGAASELAPGSAEYALRYGESLVHSGRLDLGLAALEEAVAAAPEDADARMKLARLYIVSGRSESALPHLERYIEIRGGDPSGYITRAMALVAAKRLTDAERDLELASSLADTADMSDETRELLSLATGRYHEAAGDSSLAASAYREALRFNPVSDEARRALARISGAQE